MLIPEESILYATDAMGVYIPQHFAESIKRELVFGVTDDDYKILEAGPEHEYYWDTWHDVEQRAVIQTSDGIEYSMYQDGDLWFIPKKPDPKKNIDRLLDNMREEDIREVCAEALLKNPEAFYDYWYEIDD